MRIRSTYTVAVLAGLALITAGGAASAQSGGNSTTTAETATVAPIAWQARMASGPRAFGGGAAMIDTATNYLGLTRDELLGSLRDGKTLAQIAAAQGKSVEGLIDVLVATARQELDKRVADGKITAAQRDQMAGQLEARITDFVNNGRGSGQHAGQAGFGPWASIDTVANYLGVPKDQLVEQVRGGQTLAQIATAQGKSVEGLIDVMVAAGREHLDKLVADGKITAAQRDQIAGQLEARITAFVNNGARALGSGGPSGFGPPSGTSAPSGFGPRSGSGGPPSGAPAAFFAGS